MSDNPIDPAIQVYFTLTGNLLTEAAGKDPNVSTFAEEFINQGLPANETTYGKQVIFDLGLSVVELNTAIANATGDEKLALEAQLANCQEFMRGMNVKMTDVTADEATEQFSVGPRAQVPQGEEWNKVPGIFKWAMSPYIPLPGGYQLPIPMAPMSRNVCAIM